MLGLIEGSSKFFPTLFDEAGAYIVFRIVSFLDISTVLKLELVR